MQELEASSLSNKLTIAIYALVASIVVFGLGFYFVARSHRINQSHYTQALFVFSQILSPEPIEGDALWKEADDWLNRLDPLQERFGARLAQQYLKKGQEEKASLLAKHILKSDASKPQALYAKTTFTMAKKDWQESLKQAESLDLLLRKQNSLQGFDFPALACANLMRIATLHSKLAHPSAELKALLELQVLVDNIKQNAIQMGDPVYKRLIDAISSGGVTFIQYLDARIKTLQDNAHLQ